MPYTGGVIFTPDPTYFLPAGDLDTIRQLAGADIGQWPDSVIQSAPFLPAALLTANRRIPTNWDALSDGDRQALRLAIQYSVAAQMLLQVDQSRSQTTKQGRLTISTSSSSNMTLSPSDLQSYADYYFGLITLPPGVVPVDEADSYDRPLVRVQRLFNVCGRLF